MNNFDNDTQIIKAFPLQWPPGYSRTAAKDRVHGQFSVGNRVAITNLRDEVARFGGVGLIISSNVSIRNDGFPYASEITKKFDDPGVALYFSIDGAPMCIACDKFDFPFANIRALGKTVEALRAIKRYGSTEIASRAFSGFLGLPAPDESPLRYWEVLGLEPGASEDEIKAAFRAAVKRDPDIVDTLKKARDMALRQTTK